MKTQQASTCCRTWIDQTVDAIGLHGDHADSALTRARTALPTITGCTANRIRMSSARRPRAIAAAWIFAR